MRSLTFGLCQGLVLSVMPTYFCVFPWFSATLCFPSLSPPPDGLYAPESSHLPESILFQGVKPRPAIKAQHHLVSKPVAEKLRSPAGPPGEGLTQWEGSKSWGAGDQARAEARPHRQ